MYDDFSTEYDRFVNWPSRLAYEMPFILEKLEEAGARRVLDTACGTGMHAIALAQAGYEAAGADISAGMIARARVNAQAAAVTMDLQQAGFGHLEKTFSPGRFEAVLCLGNSLPHVLSAELVVAALADFAACMKPGGLLVIQNRNFDAIMSGRSRWMEPQTAQEGGTEWLFLRFYDFEPDGMLSFNILTLRRTGQMNWQQSIGTTQLRPLLAEDLKTALEECGFQFPRLYGDMTGAPFDAASSGNLIICARLA
jgi:SAM-dependent methyltransferase